MEARLCEITGWACFVRSRNHGGQGAIPAARFKAELIACIGTKSIHGKLAGGHEDVGVGLIEPFSETGAVQNDNGCQRELEAKVPEPWRAHQTKTGGTWRDEWICWDHPALQADHHCAAI